MMKPILMTLLSALLCPSLASADQSFVATTSKFLESANIIHRELEETEGATEQTEDSEEEAQPAKSSSASSSDDDDAESPFFNANLTCQTDTIFKVYNDATCTEFNDTLTQQYQKKFNLTLAD